ncbi:MAG: hypothetical protein CMQ24_17380 [Gammaproteobacteria bacterium]|nr:hypothetical protein [Gammaproteobacteria bacterium]
MPNVGSHRPCRTNLLFFDPSERRRKAMTIKTLLVANRGEIAIRIMRTAADLGIGTVAVYPADHTNSLHLRKADEAVQLKGHSAQAYLDVADIIAAAKGSNCDAIHPG